MNIDWSKAPEDATYCLSGRDFFKLDGDGRVILFINGYTHNTLNHIGDFLSSSIVERPKKQDAWDGEGLPPVGTVCEVLWNESRVEYLRTKVFGVNEHGQPIHRFDEGPKKYQYQADVLRTASGTQVFRPIRTAEQLAEEEREDAANKMFQRFGGIGGLTKKQCIWVISEGYRKQ